MKTVTPIVECHQAVRKQISDEVLKSYMEIRPLKFEGGLAV